MQEVAKHERSIKVAEGIAKIACIAGTGKGKNNNFLFGSQIAEE